MERAILMRQRVDNREQAEDGIAGLQGIEGYVLAFYDGQFLVSIFRQLAPGPLTVGQTRVYL